MSDPQAIQWAPTGNMLDGVPEPVCRFLASADGKTRGYGWGPGWSIMFGTEHGDLTVEAGQWIIKNPDGTFSVSWDGPSSAPKEAPHV